ncbi:YheC/YheD family protein [Oceanobacillus sp. M65]|uniref:YheC/YheD family protein n=1 Tax=Oceanobacillus sp. M65 TaxID=3457435 RepID=UPI003FCC8EF9
MTTLDNKQYSQIVNIATTMVEASEHFSILIKQKNLNQSIFIFSSIAEGFDALKTMLGSLTNSLLIEKYSKLDNTLLLIATNLEKGNLLKVSEITQFTLIPQFRKFKQELELSQVNTEKKKSLTIGVYLSIKSPRDAYPETRINALVEESKKQQTPLYFFSSADVNLEKKEINAEMFIEKKWIRATVDLPDVIHNIAPLARGQQSTIEKKLRRIIPFTSFGVGDKFNLPKTLVQNREFADLLVPFKITTDKTTILNFVKENDSVVFKPLRGRRGENIYFIEQKGNRFNLLDHTKSTILSQQKLEQWLEERILVNKNSYMVQRYINSRTKAGEPYDIRAHVQKNGEGKWQLTKIYPRIGNKKSILSNISRGGRTESLTSLFSNEYGVKKGKVLEEKLINLSMDLTWHLDKLHNLSLDELGLDIALDNNDRFWLHEVNNGPQTTYHEQERAVNTIAYAKYIAKNGIVLTNQFSKVNYRKGQFNAKKSNLEMANLDNKTQIGMLVDKSEINNLTVACAYVSNYENVHFFYFTPLDIDFEEMLIRGYFFEGKEWVPKIVKYPDVVYDRLRLRGIKGYSNIYEELEGIPFTNEFFGNSISKLEVYNKLSENSSLNEVIIPYKKVETLTDTIHYINEYGKIILKPEIGSFAKGVNFISKENIDQYFVAEGELENRYTEWELRKYLSDLIKKNNYIVQQYIETRTIDDQPFDIRVHMMKDGNGEWSFIKIYPRVGVDHAVILPLRRGGYIGKLTNFLDRNFGAEKQSIIVKEIKKISLNIATSFEGTYSTNLSEIALDLAINKDLKLKLIEVNVNKPGYMDYDFELAQHAIPYAVFLADKR